MSSLYAIDQVTLASDVQTTESFLASQGLSCSGAEIIDVANLKETHVLAFLNAVLADIKTVAAGGSIDKTAIAAVIASYQAQDLAWLATQSICGTLLTPLEVTTTGYASTINSYYANAISQLNAL